MEITKHLKFLNFGDSIILANNIAILLYNCTKIKLTQQTKPSLTY